MKCIFLFIILFAYYLFFINCEVSLTLVSTKNFVLICENLALFLTKVRKWESLPSSLYLLINKRPPASLTPFPFLPFVLHNSFWLSNCTTDSVSLCLCMCVYCAWWVGRVTVTMVYGKSALQEHSVAAETDLLFKHTQLALVRPPAAVKQYRGCRPSEKAPCWGFDALNTPTHCRSQRGPQYLIRELLLSHYVC